MRDTAPAQLPTKYSLGVPDARGGSGPWTRRLWSPDIKKGYRKSSYLLLMLAPVIVWYAIFQYGPLYGVQLAFKDYNLIRGITGSPWIGFEHFRYMFTASPDFLRILRNTVIISFLDLAFGFPAPIILALVLNEIQRRKFVRISQLVIYLPHFFSWVIAASLLIEFLSPTRGPVNYIITSLGFEPVFFMGDPGIFRATLIGSRIWKDVGWGSIIYLASISSIDPQLYEAAIVDGANRWRQVRHITLPSILPVVVILLILRLRYIMDAGFDQVLNMYNYAVMEVADIIDTYVFRVGIGQIQYDFTTAVTLFKNAIALALVLLADRFARLVGQTGLF